MEKEEKIEEEFSKFEIDARITRIMLVLFLGATVFIHVSGMVDIPAQIFFILAGWLGLYLLVGLFFKKEMVKTPEFLYNFYFTLNVLDILLTVLLIHFAGGAEWIGALFLTMTIAFCGLVLPPRRLLIITFLALLFFAALLWLEYLGLVPHHSLYGVELGLYRRVDYIIPQLLMVGGVLFFIEEAMRASFELLNKKRKEVERERQKVKKALAKSKETENILKVRVRARTKELRELAEKQEDIIERRTQELQERVKELKRFRRITVGREKRMIQLKNEIEELRERLKKAQKSENKIEEK